MHSYIEGAKDLVMEMYDNEELQLESLEPDDMDILDVEMIDKKDLAIW